MNEAIEKLRAQQAKVKDRSPQWMVAQQLMDICRHEPESAELISHDLENDSMSITEAEKKIKDFADGHMSGSFSCVTPEESDRILREFYGLPPRKRDEAADDEAVPGGKTLNFLDFLR